MITGENSTSKIKQKKDRFNEWKNSFKNLSNIPEAYSLVWEASRLSTITIFSITFFTAFLPIGQALIGKFVIDTIVDSIQNSQPPLTNFEKILPLLIIEFLIISLSILLGHIQSVFERIVNLRLGHLVNTKLIRKALSLDLQFFENSIFYDKLKNARQEGSSRPARIVKTSFTLLQNVITLLSCIFILASFNLFLAIIFFLISIPSFLTQMKFSNQYFNLNNDRSSEMRRGEYLQHILTVDSSAKEIKLFNLGIPLLKRYEEIFWKFFRQDRKIAFQQAKTTFVWQLLTNLTLYGAYIWIIWITLEGHITIGDMTFYLTLFRQSQSNFQGVFSNIAQLYDGGLFMSNLQSFFNLHPQILNTKNPHKLNNSFQFGIEFRNVSFSYPNSNNKILCNINLHIKPGEKIALVGTNGAGKTTLIKLLTRLYDPSDGQILLDGVDLREYDLEDLRERIGVIFQDFVHYHAQVNENIGFGQISSLNDSDRILFASSSAGAASMIELLPNGYNTMLGHWFEKGYELSGGQWQKIALGRAFMRNAAILVLDEPTAALDAECEYDLFQKLKDLTNNKIAILISHRFSTVRMADRIVVLSEGNLTEIGSHQELMNLDGTYARLYNLQSQGYK